MEEKLPRSRFGDNLKLGVMIAAAGYRWLAPLHRWLLKVSGPDAPIGEEGLRILIEMVMQYIPHIGHAILINGQEERVFDINAYGMSEIHSKSHYYLTADGQLYWHCYEPGCRDEKALLAEEAWESVKPGKLPVAFWLHELAKILIEGAGKQLRHMPHDEMMQNGWENATAILEHAYALRSALVFLIIVTEPNDPPTTND